MMTTNGLFSRKIAAFIAGLLLCGWSATGLASENDVATTVDTEAVLQAMAKPGRLADDIARDARSKPQHVIPLLNLKTGDTVVDIFGAGGYYSELLASVVGPQGEALLHNNPGFEAWGINGLYDRFENRDPGNITRYTSSGINLDLMENSIAGALVVMAFHDLYVVPKRYNGEEYVAVGNPANAGYFLEQIYRGLKPGGRLVIVDHAAEPGMANDIAADLHRIDEEFSRREVEARGFRFVGSSDALRSNVDDRTRIVFDEDIQGKTDRFIHAFEKPQ